VKIVALTHYNYLTQNKLIVCQTYSWPTDHS